MTSKKALSGKVTQETDIRKKNVTRGEKAKKPTQARNSQTSKTTNKSTSKTVFSSFAAAKKQAEKNKSTRGQRGPSGRDTTTKGKTKDPNVFKGYKLNTQVAPAVTNVDVELIYRGLTGKLADVTPSMKQYDLYQLYVGVNMWCYLYKDITGLDYLGLVLTIKGKGLQQAIRDAEKHAVFLNSGGKRGTCDEFWDKTLSSSKNTVYPHQAQTLLKFLKRIRLESVAKSALDGFIVSNERCKRWSIGTHRSIEDPREVYDLGHPSEVLVNRLAEIFTKLTKGYKRNNSLFRLPPGATFEKDHSYLEKWRTLLQNQQWLRDHGVNMRVLHSGPQTPPSEAKRYVTVPKNLFKGRGVAPEPVARQVLGYQVADGLYDCVLKAGCDTKDQEGNRDLCMDFNYSTLDLEAASDSIAWQLGQKICRNKVLWEDLEACRSTDIITDDNRVGRIVDHHWFTMGNVCTFNLETLVFMAIVLLAIELFVSWHDRHSLSVLGVTVKELRTFKVYGDDIVVHNVLAETVKDLLFSFGFIVNEDKSYVGDDPYRESCGAEWFKVEPKISAPYGAEYMTVNATGVYFPRSLGQVPYAELVSLQHKTLEYAETNHFLIRCALDVFPTAIITNKDDPYAQYDLWVPYITVPQYAGGCDCGTLYQECKVEFKYAPADPCSMTIKDDPRYGVRSFSLIIPRQASREEIASTIAAHIKMQFGKMSGRLVYCYLTRGKIFLKTYKRPEGDNDTEMHVSVASRQSHGLPRDKETLEQLEDLMFHLRLGGALEHMKTDPYLDTTKRIEGVDRRDLIGDRDIVVQLKRCPR